MMKTNVGADCERRQKLANMKSLLIYSVLTNLQDILRFIRIASKLNNLYSTDRERRTCSLNVAHVGADCGTKQQYAKGTIHH